MTAVPGPSWARQAPQARAASGGSDWNSHVHEGVSLPSSVAAGLLDA